MDVLQEWGRRRWRVGNVERFELGSLSYPSSGYWRHELAAGVFALATQRAGGALDGVPVQYELLGEPHSPDQAAVRMAWTGGPTAMSVASHLRGVRGGAQVRWDPADRVLVGSRIEPVVDDECETVLGVGWFALVTQQPGQVLDGVPVRHQLAGDSNEQVRVEWAGEPSAAMVAQRLLFSHHPWEESGGWIDWDQRDHAEVWAASRGRGRLHLHSTS